MKRTATILTILAALAIAADSARAGLIYYSQEATSGFSHLYSYDTSTGGITDRGLIHGQRYVTDIAFDPSGELFGVGWTNSKASGTSKLYTIAPGSDTQWADWAIETVKSNKMDRSVNAAAFGPAGSLYVASAGGEFQKLTFNAKHHRWEVARTADMAIASGGDLAFSGDGQTLYAALSGGRLATIDFDANSATFGRQSVIGSVGCGEIYGLAMVEDQLYGTTISGGNYGPSRLVRIDTQTGQAAFVADLGNGVWGAAGSAGPVPEPVTLGLLALGTFGMICRRR